MHGTMKAARLHGFESTHGCTRNCTRRGRADSRSRYRRGAGSRVARRSQSRRPAHARRRRAYSPDVKTVPDLPMTIGHDGLGEIVEVGPDVDNVRVGDRVVVICSITCGFCKYCRTERQHLCQTKKTMGFLTSREGPAYLRRYKDGLWAEYCRVPAGTWSAFRATRISTKCAKSPRSTSATAPSNGRGCIAEKPSWSTALPGSPASAPCFPLWRWAPHRSSRSRAIRRASSACAPSIPRELRLSLSVAANRSPTK